MHWPLTMRFGPVMPHPAIAWAGGYKLPNAGFAPKISDWAIGDVHINRLESTGSAAIALVVILRNITIGSLAPDAPAVWFKNAKNIHFQNVMIAGHAIKQLHAVARYHGQDVILAWKPYPNAARYIAFVLLCSRRQTCHTTTKSGRRGRSRAPSPFRKTAVSKYPLVARYQYQDNPTRPRWI